MQLVRPVLQIKVIGACVFLVLTVMIVKQVSFKIQYWNYGFAIRLYERFNENIEIMKSF